MYFGLARSLKRCFTLLAGRIGKASVTSDVVDLQTRVHLNVADFSGQLAEHRSVIP